MKLFENPAVAQVFRAYPPHIRCKLMVLRELIFNTGACTKGVGKLEETLKWGEPAYLTSESKSGSTIRLGWKQSNPSQYAIYFNCRTNLIETFSTIFPKEFKLVGNRAIVFNEYDTLPVDSLVLCIAMALTYHHNKATMPGRHING